MRPNNVCGICLAFAPNAHTRDNPLCRGCLQTAREASGVAVAPPPTRTVDFDFLPLLAGLRYGPVPTHTTSEDFQLAACRVSADLETHPEAHWHIEAVRERRLNPGRSLNDAADDVNARVVRRLAEATS